MHSRLSSHHHHGQCRALLSSRRSLFTPVSLGTKVLDRTHTHISRLGEGWFPLKMKLSIFTCNPLATYKRDAFFATPFDHVLLCSHYAEYILDRL